MSSPRWRKSCAPRWRTRSRPAPSGTGFRRSRRRTPPLCASRPIAQLLAESHYAGTVELYSEPPRLVAEAGTHPRASEVARWQDGTTFTNLRHEPLRLDDPAVVALVRLMDGTLTRDELAQRIAPMLPAHERGNARERVDAYLRDLAMLGFVAG